MVVLASLISTVLAFCFWVIFVILWDAVLMRLFC